MNKSVVTELKNAEYVEFAPVIWKPMTGGEKLAAIVGYMTGDGAIHRGIQKYKKKNGDISECDKVSGAFYSNERDDLVEIQSDLTALGFSSSKIGVKKTLGERANGFQIQVSKSACLELNASGVPIGKKTTLQFDIPTWIKDGEAGVKRAYLSSLFGAEGSTPSKDRSSKGRLPRTIVMAMCKIAPACADAYFKSLVEMLSELGVNSSYSKSCAIRFEKPYITYAISITGSSDIFAFFENVGYSYCGSKSKLAWKWSKYIHAYNYAGNARRETVIKMSDSGAKFSDIGLAIGLTKGAAHRLMTDIRAGKSVRAGNNFPHFDEWIKERWNDELNLLRVQVASKKIREKKESVFNVLVASSDHSYLLASGVNNYNSFETMSGRVYHPFDRKIHIRNVAFDPEKPIWVGQDFNIDPMSSVILQPQEDGTIHAIDEIVLRGSNTEEVCDELEKRYWRYTKQVYLFPDPAGQYRQHARGESDLDIFRERGFAKQRFHRKHPPVADRVNAVNRMLKAADGKVRLLIDPKCKHLISSLEQTIYKRGSREIDKDADIEHSADAIGYCIHYQFPVRRIDIAGVSI